MNSQNTMPATLGARSLSMLGPFLAFGLFLALSGCRLGNDGDDADSPRIALDEPVKDAQIDGSTVIPEAAGGLMLLMGMGALWATNRGWRF